jgi:hypothetical protein
MSVSVWYWFLMAVWLLYALWAEYRADQPYPFRRSGFYLLLFLLLLMLGWRVFQAPIHGG